MHCALMPSLVNKILTLKLSSLWSYHAGLGVEGLDREALCKKRRWGDGLWTSGMGVFNSLTYHYNCLALDFTLLSLFSYL